MSDGGFLVIPDATTTVRTTNKRSTLAVPCTLAVHLDAEFWHRYVEAIRDESERHQAAS